MSRAVFLDRDDTLLATSEATAGTDHPGDLVDPAGAELLPGVAGACADLARAGYLLIVVSNQGCVARGTATMADVEAVNRRLLELVPSIHDVLFCPYHPAGSVPGYAMEHPWRKPAPGMILEAARRHRIDLSGSWLVGDGERDVQAAIAAGIPAERALLIGSPALPDLPSAAGVILRAGVNGSRVA